MTTFLFCKALSVSSKVPKRNLASSFNFSAAGAVLLFSAALLASTSTARAQLSSITYDIVNQPLLETDINSSHQDTVCGTITVSSSAGSVVGLYNNTDTTLTLSWNITIQPTMGFGNTAITYTGSSGLGTILGGTLDITSTSISLEGGSLNLESPSASIVSPPAGTVVGQLFWNPSADIYQGDVEVTPNGYTGAGGTYFSNSNPDAVFGETDWVIATTPVPEPTTCLFGLALAGVAGLGWKRFQRAAR